DLAVGPLLDGAHARRAYELVDPLAPAALDRQQDGLGAHVHFPASGTGRPDGGHFEGGIGDARTTLERFGPKVSRAWAIGPRSFEEPQARSRYRSSMAPATEATSRSSS